MEENPHKVQDFEDPVFDSSSASQLGTTIRHGGKARKGDGNDVSPNPKKLVQIGSQIKKLNKQINSFAPLSELPVSTRNKSKKEKNKLASRACRLKKKAQHEANKVKLYGLDIEHKQLLNVIDTIKEDLHNFIVKKGPQLKFSTRLQSLVKENLTIQVAGNTTEYVNTVITKVEAGDPKGGLDSSKKSRVQNEHTWILSRELSIIRHSWSGCVIPVTTKRQCDRQRDSLAAGKIPLPNTVLSRCEYLQVS